MSAKTSSARLGTDLGLYRRLVAEARPYWPHLGGVFLLGLLATPIALLTPVPLAMAVDAVTGGGVPSFLEAVLPGSVTGSTTGALATAATLLVLVALLAQFQQFGVSVLGTYTGEKLLLSFRARLFRRVQRLSLAFHDRRGTADSTYRIQYDATSIQWIAIYGVTPFVGAAFTLAGMLYVTARIDWELALIALAVVPVLFVLTATYRRRLRARWKTTKNLESEALRVVQEVLTSLRVVKAFGAEDREEERFLLRSGQGTRARIRLAAIEGLFGFLTGVTVAIGSAAVLYVGGTHVVQGTITPGQLTLVFGYLLGLYVPLQQISKSIVTLQSSLASAERAFSLLDEVQEVPEAPQPRRLLRARGAVVFRDVTFAYEGARPALDHVSFAVPAGTRVGIAGATGAGKTTLANLLTRFYDPTSGAILLDGVDLREYRLADLRRQFAIVLQEPVLFSTTIAENIAYARPGATLEEIVAASRAADADRFIRALPDGYDTVVGERGMRLSGGERQRVSLARAFLKDAPILILDEPTSSVDVKTEATIMEAMERLMQRRTAFLIAHRLSTLDACDTRLEVDGGRLAALSPEAVAQ